MKGGGAKPGWDGPCGPGTRFRTREQAVSAIVAEVGAGHGAIGLGPSVVHALALEGGELAGVRVWIDAPHDARVMVLDAAEARAVGVFVRTWNSWTRETRRLCLAQWRAEGKLGEHPFLRAGAGEMNLAAVVTYNREAAAMARLTDEIAMDGPGGEEVCTCDRAMIHQLLPVDGPLISVAANPEPDGGSPPVVEWPELLLDALSTLDPFAAAALRIDEISRLN